MSLNVGDTGIFYTTGISIPRVNYTIIAINTSANIVALTIDVFKMAYESYGITKEEYLLHPSDTKIYTLKDELGISINVPEPYLSTVSEDGYIAYADHAMVINLGSWADREFNGLSDTITSIVTSRLGITPTIKITKITRDRLIPLEDHDYIEFRRDNLSANYIDPDVLLKKAHDDLNSAYRQISAYQKYISNYLVNCKKRCDDVVEPPIRPPSYFERVFDIKSPCYVRNYPIRLATDDDVVTAVRCGGLLDTLFRSKICISPTYVYRCKDQPYIEPTRDIDRSINICPTLPRAVFSNALKICPVKYYLCKR